MSSAKACLVPVGGFWDSYRFTSSIHPSIFSLSSSSLHLPGDRMCLKRDDFFAPVDGPYRLLSLLHDSKPFALSVFRTIMKGSPSSKFCNTLFAWDDFSSKSSTGSAVPMPKAAESGTSPIHSHSGILVFCPCQNLFKTFSNSEKIEKMNDSNLIFQRKKLSLSFPVYFFQVFLLRGCRSASWFSFCRFSSHWLVLFGMLLAWIAGPMDCPAISTPGSLVSRAASLSHVSCSICPSCINLWFISWICCSVTIGHTSQGTLLPEPQLRYHFHKLSLANTQLACFSRARCLGPSWAKLEPKHIQGAKFQQYIYMYVCMNVWMYECMNVCIYLSICLSIYLCIYVCMYVSMCVPMYLSMYVSMYVSMYLCILCIYVSYVCMYLMYVSYVCMYVSTYLSSYLSMYLCIYVCACMCMYVHVCA